MLVLLVFILGLWASWSIYVIRKLDSKIRELEKPVANKELELRYIRSSNYVAEFNSERPRSTAWEIIRIKDMCSDGIEIYTYSTDTEVHAKALIFTMETAGETDFSDLRIVFTELF